MREETLLIRKFKAGDGSRCGGGAARKGEEHH